MEAPFIFKQWHTPHSAGSAWERGFVSVPPYGQSTAESVIYSMWAETARKIAVPQGQDGQAWLLDLKRPTQGVFEDVTVGFSDNIPPYLVWAKERLLVPTP